MFPQILIKHNIGNTITIPNELDVIISGYTSNNVAAAATSVPTGNAAGFTSGSTILLLLGSIAMENAEIVTSASHTPTLFTTSALTQNHNRGELISQLKWDQIVVYKSATVDGTYVQLGSNVPFQVTQGNTVINDAAGLTTDFYKVQWRNSVTSTVSSFSTPISVLTYLPSSAGYMFKSIMNQLGISERDKAITPEFLLNALDDGRQFCESKLYGIRQSWKQVFEYPIKVLAGRTYIELPDNIDFNETDASLLSARFITNNILTPYNMRYVDKRTMNQVRFYSTGGITTQDYSIGATSITLDSVGNFPPQGGSAQVATSNFDQVVIEIEYTSIDLITNELLGVTGLTRAIPEGTQIWASTSMNQPIWYTVYEGRLWFSSPIPDSMQGNNCYIDYYKRMEPITNFYDVIPEHYREMYKWYIRWAIKYRKDITTPSDDPDLKKFEECVDSLFNNLYTGQETIIITS